MEGLQGLQALETEACKPYWKTGWESVFRGGGSKPPYLSLSWLPHRPSSQAPHLYRWSLSPEAPEDSPDPVYREKDTCVG